MVYRVNAFMTPFKFSLPLSGQRRLSRLLAAGLLLGTVGCNDAFIKTPPVLAQKAEVQPAKAVATSPTANTRQSKAMFSGRVRKAWTFYRQELRDGARVHSSNYSTSAVSNKNWQFDSMTISEGQSYALLKAVRMNDRQTFDTVWNWTRQNMQRPNDHLLGWLWGLKKTGKGIIADDHVASDADQDIAYALILASKRWPDGENYQKAALEIIRDLREECVKSAGNRLVLTSGTYHQSQKRQLGETFWTVNPSYLAPYAYREFARLDKEGAVQWHRLAADAANIWRESANLTKTGLIPDFVGVDEKTGKVHLLNWGQNTSWDAFRVYTDRIPIEKALNRDVPTPVEDSVLVNAARFLSNYREAHGGQLPAGFRPGGQPISEAAPNTAFMQLALFASQAALSPNKAQELYTRYIGDFERQDEKNLYWNPIGDEFLQAKAADAQIPYSDYFVDFQLLAQP